MGKRAVLGLLMLIICGLAEAIQTGDPAAPVKRPRADSVPAQIAAAKALADRVGTVSLLTLPETGESLLVIGDRYGIMRVSEFTEYGLREIWKSNTLEGAIFEVRTADLDADGSPEIVVRSRVGGHIHVFNSNFETVWASINREYDTILALDLANVDSDPAIELIILADEGNLDYVDGKDFVLEFRSNQVYRADDMKVGNVDIDDTLEIVLNTGIVLDSQDAEPEWATGNFGSYIELFDIDGDGIEEILAHEPFRPMIIYDAENQQEKPLQ
jgi:hypothetical protein